MEFLQLNGDRAYKVELKKGLKEIVLSARAVNGLLGLNISKRENSAVDKNFVKVLLIAVCTIKRIRASNLQTVFEDGEKDNN